MGRGEGNRCKLTTKRGEKGHDSLVASLNEEKKETFVMWRSPIRGPERQKDSHI